MASEASEEVEIGCAARAEGAETRVGETDEVEAAALPDDGNEGEVEL